MQAFSRSLMVNILQLNKHLVAGRNAIAALESVNPKTRLCEGEETTPSGKTEEYLTEARL